MGKEKAQVIEYYDDMWVNSATKKHQVPSVIRVNMIYNENKFAKFGRENVYIRDNYTCQYCGAFGSEVELTFDHVYPKVKGGQTTWMNIVTACGPCNRKKGCMTLKQCRMELKQTPFIPKWTPRSSLRIKKSDPEAWQNYIKY